MGGVLRELLEGGARVVGARGIVYWLQDADMGTLVLIGAVIVLCFLGIAWVVGKATQHPDHFAIEGDGSVVARGGCLAIVLGGIALIFIAAVTWAWRYLFG